MSSRPPGWRCRVVADDNALVDREAAFRAGIGWYGKNANLLLPGRGSWFVLGSVVTDAPLATRGRPLADGCGACTRCIDGCPTGAIVAPGVVDARRCLAWLLQMEGPFPRDHRVALGDRLYGCDDCQEVCPPNNRADRIEPATEAAPGAQPVVDLLDLLAASDDDLMARYGRWYVPRREARYLRRNALVVLGNVADPRDPAGGDAVPAPGRCRSTGARHAVWAARRLGRSDLLTEVADVADDPTRWSEPSSRPQSTRARCPRSARGADTRCGGRLTPGRSREAPRVPPPRHQRLPAQARGHPVVPVGAGAGCLPTASRC